MAFQMCIMMISMLLLSEYSGIHASTSFVNGFSITITSNSLPRITHQVNNESVREFVVNGL